MYAKIPIKVHDFVLKYLQERDNMVDSDLKKVSYYRCYAKDCLNANDFKQARYYIKKALSILPEHFETIFINGLIEKKARNYETAIKSFEYLASTATFRAKALYELGEIYFDLEKYYKSLEYFEDYCSEAVYAESILVSYQNQGKGLTKMAYIYNIVQDYDREIQIYNKLIELENTNKYGVPQNIYNIYLQIANAYFLKHDLTNTLKYYQMTIKEDNKYLDKTYVNIATLYFNNHNLDYAEKMLNMALNKNPQNNDAKFLLAKIKAIKQDYDYSLKILKSLLKTNMQKEAAEQIIYLLFKMEKHEEIKQFTNDTKSLPNILNIVKSKKQELAINQNYSYEKVISNLKHTLNHKVNGNIKQLFKNIKKNMLLPQYYYGSDIFDNYIIPIANIGYIDNERTDFLYVKTLVNTHNIVDMYPCLNLNNDHKISDQNPLILNLTKK